MVLTQKVGKKRSFARGLLLTIFTFGIYGFYWLYKAHDEVFKQFELDREGRDEGVVWLILGLLLFPFQLVYMWMFVGNVQYLRKRLELREGVSPGVFLGLHIAGYVAFFVGYIPFVIALAGLDAEATDEQAMTAIGAALGGLFLGLLVGFVLMGIAYYRLQHDVNDVWDAYDSRIQALAAPPTNGAPAAPGAASYTYWGDLRPPQATLSAPHVRARADALARDHAGVALPPELPDLLARGEAGDQAALSAAAALMDGIDRLLAERRQLKSDLEAVERRQERLAGRLADGQVDATAYATARAELDRERARIEARLADVDGRLFTSPASTG